MAKEAAQGAAGAIEELKSWPQRFKDYVDGLRLEMRRVSWPNKKQVQSTTIVVIVTVFLFAFFFAIVDYALQMTITRLMNYFTSR